MINLYQNLYDLINNYIFAGSLIEGTYPELITVLFATAACFFLLALPFVIIICFVMLMIKAVK